MKPSLNEVLKAVLNVLNMDPLDWDQHHKSRIGRIVRAKELFCLLAYEEGYAHSEIGRFLELHRTSSHHYVKQFRTQCEIYPSCKSLLESARLLLPRTPDFPKAHCRTAWLARCRSGLLVQSPGKPEDVSGWWVAEGSRPFYDQRAFPQITYESGPAKVIINVILDDHEEV